MMPIDNSRPRRDRIKYFLVIRHTAEMEELQEMRTPAMTGDIKSRK